MPTALPEDAAPASVPALIRVEQPASSVAVSTAEISATGPGARRAERTGWSSTTADVVAWSGD